MNYYDKLNKIRLEDAVEDKYKVLAGIRAMGREDFSDAVHKWWRHYGVVEQRSRRYRGVDIVAHDSATDYIDFIMRRL